MRMVYYYRANILILFCRGFRSGDRRRRTENRAVHRTHRRVLFLAAGHHRASHHRVRHLLGKRDRVYGPEEHGDDRRRIAGTGVRHEQQHHRNIQN